MKCCRASHAIIIAMLGTACAFPKEETSDYESTAKQALQDEFAKDPALQQELQTLLENGEYQKVVNALEGKYPQVAESSVAVIDERWYETPRDKITNASGEGLDNWFYRQEWRYMLSPVGRPFNRKTRDVYINYVTVRNDNGTNNGTKGAMVVSIGRGESIRQWSEFAYDLMMRGYSPIYIFAHRGQGESDRLLEGEDMKQYVEKGNDFVHDLRALTEMVAAELQANLETKDRPLYLVCHSMGCAVAFLYFIQEYEARRQNRYYAAAGISPGIKPRTAPFPFGVAISIANLMCHLGQGRWYAPTQSRSFEQDHLPQVFVTTRITHSFTRFQELKRYCAEYRNKGVGHDNHTSMCIHGMSARFVKEFFAMYIDFFDFMAIDGKKLEIPLLLQTAGDNVTGDPVLHNEETFRFCETSVQDCTQTSYPKGKHGLHREVDDVRDRLLTEIDDFLQKYQTPVETASALPPGIAADGEGCNNDRDCMSRNCDAHYGFDIFGGTCRPISTFLSNATPGIQAPHLLMLLLMLVSMAFF